MHGANVTPGGKEAPENFFPTTSSCITHLSLLEAFVALADRVKSHAQRQGIDPSQLWDDFVGLAAVRFTIWLHDISQGQNGVWMPPLGRYLGNEQLL